MTAEISDRFRRYLALGARVDECRESNLLGRSAFVQERLFLPIPIIVQTIPGRSKRLVSHRSVGEAPA
jgi:hypothetical protein